LCLKKRGWKKKEVEKEEKKELINGKK